MDIYSSNFFNADNNWKASDDVVKLFEIISKASKAASSRSIRGSIIVKVPTDSCGCTCLIAQNTHGEGVKKGRNIKIYLKYKNFVLPHGHCILLYFLLSVFFSKLLGNFPGRNRSRASRLVRSLLFSFEWLSSLAGPPNWRHLTAFLP